MYLHPDKAGNHRMSNEDLVGSVEVFERAQSKAVGRIEVSVSTAAAAVVVAIVVTIIAVPGIAISPASTPRSISICPVRSTAGPVSLDEA